MPRKRGGAEFGPDTAIERGPLTCPNCHGGGRVAKVGAGTDRTDAPEGNVFDDDALMKCPECEGSGKVGAKK